MIKTKYGDFDGNKWEAICQVCFKLKYEQDSYQEIKASPGDHGIEGFTRKGDVFQCYCPEKEYTQDELHEKIRDKITEDLKKLDTFKKELKSKLNGTKIKRWILVTPDYERNKIIDHCAKKSQEYRQLGLDILDKEFDVLIYDADFYSNHLIAALSSIGERLYIEPDSIISQDIEDFKGSGSEQAINIISKSIAIIGNVEINENANKSEKLAKSYIKQYLDGYSVITKLQTRFKESYEKYIRNVDEMATHLDQKIILSDLPNNKFIEELNSEVRERINNEFAELDPATRNRMSYFVVASWLADCPLRFDDL